MQDFSAVWESMLRDEREVIDFLLGEEFSERNNEMVEPIVIECDEVFHTAENGYQCDDPTCPCREEEALYKACYLRGAGHVCYTLLPHDDEQRAKREIEGYEQQPVRIEWISRI